MKKLLFVLLCALNMACIKPNPCGELSPVGNYTNVYYGTSFLKKESRAYMDSVETPVTYITNTADKYVYPKVNWIYTLNHVYAPAKFIRQDNCGMNYYINPEYKYEKFELKMLNSVWYNSFSIFVEKDLDFFNSNPIDSYTVTITPDRIKLEANYYTYPILPAPAATDKQYKQVTYDTLTLGRHTWKNLRYSYLDSAFCANFKQNVPVGYYYDLKKGVVGFNWKNGTRWYLE